VIFAEMPDSIVFLKKYIQTDAAKQFRQAPVRAERDRSEGIRRKKRASQA